MARWSASGCVRVSGACGCVAMLFAITLTREFVESECSDSGSQNRRILIMKSQRAGWLKNWIDGSFGLGTIEI